MTWSGCCDFRCVCVCVCVCVCSFQRPTRYGFSKDAEPFDEACGRWARSVDSEELLSTALPHATNAKSCGYPGLVILDGLMNHAGTTTAAPAAGPADVDSTNNQPHLLRGATGGSGSGSDSGRGSVHGVSSTRVVVWNSTLVVGPFHPTYYGMMAAMFYPNN